MGNWKYERAVRAQLGNEMVPIFDREVTVSYGMSAKEVLAKVTEGMDICAKEVWATTSQLLSSLCEPSVCQDQQLFIVNSRDPYWLFRSCRIFLVPFLLENLHVLHVVDF